MAQQRQATTREQDPCSGSFSQARVTPAAASWPVLQWHGGLASLVGDTDSIKVMGGFFIEDDRIAELGLDPAYPAAGFERL